MIVTPTAAGRPRPRRRVWASALAVAIGAGLALLPAMAPLMPVASATAATPTPTPTPSGRIDVVAAPFGSGVVVPGAEAVVVVQAHNGTAATVAASEAVVSFTREPLADRAAVADWLDGGAGTGTPVEAGRVASAALPPDGEANLAVGITAEVLEGLAPGVYPVEATIAGERTRTVITLTAATPVDRSVAVVVPVTAGALETGLLTGDALAELTAPDGALSATLDAVAGTSAILAVDPAIPAAIRLLGAGAPESAQEWLDTLVELPNERFALQFGDADVATQVGAGLDALLGPTTLAPSAAADVEDTELDALTGIGFAAPDVFWPATGTAGAEAAAAVAAFDDTETAPLTLIDSASVDGASPARAAAGDAQLLVYDADISTALADAAGIEDATERAAALAVISAQAALSGSGPLVAVVDRPDEIGRVALRAAITTLTAAPGAQPLTLAAARAQSGEPVSLRSITADDARVDVLRTLREDERTLTEFATVLVEPAQLTSRERTAMLQLLGNAWRGDTTAWSAAVTAHMEGTGDTLGAVGIVNRAPINFLATSAPLPVTVRNELPWPISAVLVARTDDPRLIVQNSTVVDIGADQNTRVDLPVEARVGSGELTLDLQLRSPTMIAIGDSQLIDLSVRAEWETVGLTVTAVLVSVLLVGGVVRTVIKLRRRDTTVDTGTRAESDGTDEEGTA